MTGKNKNVCVSLIFFALLLGSCVSAAKPQAPAPQKTAQKKAGGETRPLDAGRQEAKAQESIPLVSPYYLENKDSLKVYTLDNGIPLVVKAVSSNRIVAVKLIVRGTASCTPAGKEGLERLTLNTMGRGSLKYAYDQLQGLAYKTSSVIGGVSSNYDYSSFDLVCLDKYFDDAFDAFADCFLNPSLNAADFQAALGEMRASRSGLKADPYNYATSLLHQITFKNHPYARDPQGLDYSLANMSLPDVQDYRKTLLGAERLAIVAVGNFDPDTVFKRINSSFGKILKGDVKLEATPTARIDSGLTLVPFPDSQAIAYIRGDFNVPAIASRDSAAYAVGATILTDLLYDIVRVKHGACYTPMALNFGYASPYGSIVIYKSSVPGAVKGYMDEAVKTLVAGKTPNLQGQAGAEYGDLSATIEGYKAKYINAFFGGQETNQSVAEQIAASYVRFGDPTEYLKLIDKVNAVSAQDVERVMKKCVQDGRVSWIIISDQDTLNAMDKAPWSR
jgi:zinc protease